MGRDTAVPDEIYEMQSEICRTMGHPVRLRILDLLEQREHAASELVEHLALSKANLSKHMSILVQAGIVSHRRTGRSVRYHLAYPQIHQACSILRSVLLSRIRKEAGLASLMGPQSRG